MPAVTHPGLSDQDDRPLTQYSEYEVPVVCHAVRLIQAAHLGDNRMPEQDATWWTEPVVEEHVLKFDVISNTDASEPRSVKFFSVHHVFGERAAIEASTLDVDQVHERRCTYRIVPGGQSRHRRCKEMWWPDVILVQQADILRIGRDQTQPMISGGGDARVALLYDSHSRVARVGPDASQAVVARTVVDDK